MYDVYIFSMLQHIADHRKNFLPCQLGDRRTDDYNEESKETGEKTISFAINFEHVLVKPGGDEHAPTGKINIKDSDGFYLCRVDKLESHLLKADVIIDYSLPNIINVDKSNLGGLYQEYLRKVLYISPLLFSNCQFAKKERTLDTLTTFLHPSAGGGRRQHILTELTEAFPTHQNVNTYANEKLQDLLLNTKVLVNIHQTEYHDTLEELRILPALQCGTIVISEHAGLTELVPYQNMIIWASRENVVDITKKVLADYDRYYDEIFTDTNKRFLDQMRIDNYIRLERRLISMNLSLDDLSKHYNLDKNIASGCHNYIPGYTSLFEKRRFHVKNVLEIGIGVVEHGQMSGVVGLGYKTGNSLRCWRDYFLCADIHGMDLYPSGITKEPRITTYLADQSNLGDLERVMTDVGMCDVIVDDGSHDVNHQIFSFTHLAKYVKPNGGVYVIEDVQEKHDEFKDLTVFPHDVQEYIRTNFDVQCFDTRNERGRADDFLIAFIRK